ncbi:transcriptional regulator, TetR family [Pseudonocardia ammonioxydans]|uniref:Transcriptional regulator, TetR family n=1 Tax=Pseudonocardia ammonioxydans TaxID=260086 RepID=A0A1I5FVW1_PSUAM|nr:TetR/AcrR family transcriptional regulator [Pseudonocardia ammonioxydans]SFO27736.1 transcriptional regulator, TetR family [Pseudonocardia ammonioxydans]
MAAPPTRKQQREQTRAQLLDAAVFCLVEYGYAGTTTQRVQDRVNVSRGALSHHFGSKADLLVAAIHHIADERLELLRAAADGIEPGPDALPQVVAAISAAMSGPPFLAALELWVSARTDPELRAALLPPERRLGQALRDIFDKATAEAEPEATRQAFESLLIFLRGLAITGILRRDDCAVDEAVGYWMSRMAPVAAPRNSSLGPTTG